MCCTTESDTTTNISRKNVYERDITSISSYVGNKLLLRLLERIHKTAVFRYTNHMNCRLRHLSDNLSQV